MAERWLLEAPNVNPMLVDILMEKMTGAMTVSQLIALPSGATDAVVIAATPAAASLFGYGDVEELKGRLSSSLHKPEHALRARLYAWARMIGAPEAPSSYPICIQTQEGQWLWVQKDVEQRTNERATIWMAHHTLLSQERDYQMPAVPRLHELVHAHIIQNVLQPSHIPGRLFTDDELDALASKIVNVDYYKKLTLAIQEGNATGIQESAAMKGLEDRAEAVSLECVRCQHRWVPYVQRPKKCPHCKQTWDKPKAWTRRRRERPEG